MQVEDELVEEQLSPEVRQLAEQLLRLLGPTAEVGV